jgi:transcriptional regulator with XRE-family HTH domain
MTDNGQLTLGRQLRLRRAELGLTLEQLAEQAGVSVRAISDIERGRTTQPRRVTVRLLAGVLGLGDAGGPPAGARTGNGALAGDGVPQIQSSRAGHAWPGR